MAVSPEAYLISSILRDQDYTTAMAHGASSVMFHAYKAEYEWLERFYSKHRKVPTKVAFKRKFPDFPMKAVNDTPHFVEEVRNSHARALLLENIAEATDLVANGQVDRAVSLMTTRMNDVASSLGVVRDTDIIKDFDSVLNDVRIRKAQFEEFGRAGIPTGFSTFDERTGGIGKGQSCIIGARLGEGKSWTLIRMAVAAVINGHNVHFAALEMSRPEVGMRFHNLMSSAVGKEIFQAVSLSQGKDFDIKAYRQFLRDLRSTIKGSLTVSDDNRIGAVEIRSQLERHKPDIYFLDYLTLAKTSGDGGWQDIGNFSKELKRLAGEYNVAMVSAAQLNRTEGLGKQISGPEALAQSDAIGQDADIIINLKQRSAHVTEYGLVKYRHGRAGYTWHAHIDFEKGIFEEVTFNRAQKLIDADLDALAKEKENSRV